MPKLEVPEELDSLEDIPAKFHGLYVPKPGGDGFVYQDPKKVSDNNRALKVEKADIADKLKQVDKELAELKAEMGDPEEIRELRKKKKLLEESEAVLDGRLSDIKADLEKRGKLKEEEFTGRITKTQRSFGQFAKTNAVEAALAGAGVVESSIKHLKRLISDEITVTFEDDEPVLKILDPLGKPRLNDNADHFTIADLVAVYRKELPMMFKGNGQSGGGGGGSDGDISAPEDKKPSLWSDKQRHAYIKANGHQAYLALVGEEQRTKNKSKAA